MRKIWGIFIVILIIITISSLNYAQKPTQANNKIKFTEIAESIGLKLEEPHGNIAWGDYNNDGYQDLLVDGRQLFRNSGPPKWQFEDVTTKVDLKAEGQYGTWIDYNNDGFLDIFSFGHKKSLWKNTGKPNFKFVNVTDQAGDLNDEFYTVAAVCLDYNSDGYPDLYLVNYEHEVGKGLPDRFLHNEKGKFVDVTEKVGMGIEKTNPLPGRSAAIGDYNNDGLLDIYVSNYRLCRNYLWEQQKDGTFKDVAEEKNVAGINRRNCFGHTIASVFGDIDNDGLLDLVVGNFAHKDPFRGQICDDTKIYRNLGSNAGYKFEDIREAAGIPLKKIGGEEEPICGVAFGDFDNDGLLDLYITQIYDELPYAYSYLYHNQTTKETQIKFKDVSEESGSRIWDTYVCTVVDYDNDGDLDLVTGGKAEKFPKKPRRIRFFKNETLNKNKWLKVTLRGTHCNKFGIGARITVYAGNEMKLRIVSTTMSNTSYSPTVVHFGLGEIKTIDKMEIRWPCGKIQKIDKPPLNKLHIIEEK